MPARHTKLSASEHTIARPRTAGHVMKLKIPERTGVNEDYNLNHT